MVLPEWNDLSVKERRSLRALYERIRIEINGDTPVTRNIHIDVGDGENAISGATVVIGKTTRTTGDAGGCNFTGVADGAVSVEVSATGYVTKTETVTVSENNTSFTISLTAAEDEDQS